MPGANFVQTSFGGGEWSPSAQGRLDHPLYRRAMNRALNTIVTLQENAIRRPGTKLVGNTRGGAAARLLPFQVPNSVAYNMEFTDEHLRFVRGGDMLTVGGGQTVTDISTASPAVMTLGAAVDWATDDQVVFSFGDYAARDACPSLALRQFSVSMVTTSTFRLYDAVTGVALDGSTVGWSAGLAITVAKVADLATPYDDGAWSGVKAVQAQNQAILLHADNAPQSVVATPSGTEATFAISPAALKDGPYLDPATGSQMTPSATNGIVTMTLSFTTWDSARAYAIGNYVSKLGNTYVSLTDGNQNHDPASDTINWTYANAGAPVGPNGFTVEDVGRHIRLHSEPPDWVTGTTYAIGQVVKFNNLYWTALAAMTGASPSAGSINPNQPGNLATSWALNPTGHLWTWGKVTGLGSTGVINVSGAAGQGDMVYNGGLTATFDGFTSQDHNACCAGVVSGGQNWAGLVDAQAKQPTSVRVYPSSDLGFVSDATLTYSGLIQCTLEVYGKNTNPASATDGTKIGTSGLIFNSKNPVTIITTAPTTYLWVWVRVVSSQTYSFLSEVQYSGSGVAGTVVDVQILGSALLYTSDIREWRLGLYGDTSGWPTCGGYYQGRLLLGGAVANHWDASVSNDVLNFAPTDPLGVVADNNAISYTFNSTKSNNIQWMKADRHGVIMGTEGGEWLVQPASGTLSPTSVKGDLVTEYGSRAVEPIYAGSSVVFTQLYGRDLFEYVADNQAGEFFGQTIADKAQHLTKGVIAELGYQPGRSPIIWARKEDGSLAAVTYKRSIKSTQAPPDILAWHRHELGNGHLVESISVAASPSLLLPALGMVTRDANQETRYLSVMLDPAEDDDPITSAWLLDNAIVPICGKTYGSNTGIDFYGLAVLENQTVDVWAAGIDCGSFTVTNGVVRVPYSGIFTKRALTQIAGDLEQDFGDLAVPIDAGATFVIPVVIGHAYTSQGQILRPVAQADTGAANGPAFGKTRRAHEYAVMLKDTQGISVGTDFDKLRPCNFRSPGGRAISETELFSGIHHDTVEDEYSFDSLFCWEVSRPYPANVLAVGEFLHTQDR